ncbi:MAG: PAS-domain containing protein [Chloroflexi bacterium]|nr:PAS-domain containing protein [Chloroflexota bacterium]
MISRHLGYQLPSASGFFQSPSHVARQAAATARAFLEAPVGGCALRRQPATWMLAAVASSGPVDPAVASQLYGWMLATWLPLALAGRHPLTLEELGVSPESMPPAVAAAGVATVLVAPFPADRGCDGVIFVGLESAEASQEQRLGLRLLAETVASALGQETLSSALVLGTLLDGFPDGCELYDADWCLLYVNAAHRALFALPEHAIGWSLDEVVASCAEALAQPEALARAVQAHRSAPLHIQRFELETRAPHSHVLERVVAPIPGAVEPAGYLVLYRDVTEVRIAERLKDEFLSIASHELKTPLTTLKGYSQIMQRQISNVTAHAKAMKEAFNFDLLRALHDSTALREEADRLARLVDQLLDISRIQTGRLALNLQPVDLRVLVPETIESLRVALDGYTIRYDPPRRRTPLVVQGDADRLKQVLTNLLENAAHYSPPDQPITVQLRQRRQGTAGRRYARLTVNDHGVGIAPEDLNRIFERFYRATKDATAHRGLGLGLYISSEIIRQHHGRIWAESAGPNTGSRFSIELPLAPHATPPAA